MSNNNSKSDEREFESNTRTQKNQKNDPLTEYSEKEPMTPAKIKEHEPTAVKRDPNDQTIVGGGQTGTDSPEALEAKQWLAAVKEDKEPLVQPEQAFVVTKILDAIYQSAETGKEVVFEKELDVVNA